MKALESSWHILLGSESITALSPATDLVGDKVDSVSMHKAHKSRVQGTQMQPVYFLIFEVCHLRWSAYSINVHFYRCRRLSPQHGVKSPEPYWLTRSLPCPQVAEDSALNKGTELLNQYTWPKRINTMLFLWQSNLFDFRQITSGFWCCEYN